MSLFKDLPETSPNEKDARKRLETLYEQIAYHNRRYHELDAPEISDADYDKLFQEAVRLEKQFPQLKKAEAPTNRVGNELQNKFEKVSHKIPMLSLENAFDEEDVANFITRARKLLNLTPDNSLEIVGEPKIDGLSASLHYEKGQLVLGATRGDGLTGENITHTIKTIQNIPHHLKGSTYPEKLEVRGEIFLSKEAFAQLNHTREEEGLPLFANPRNAAAGSVRQLDASIAAKRPLQFFAYSLATPNLKVDSQQETLDLLKRWGFSVAENIQLCHSLDDIMHYYKGMNERRASLPFDIDGVVYKINATKDQERMGFVARAPRWALAHKFAAEQGETVLNAITIQVGRTGVLTPVGELEPINIGGVLVSRVSLHNADELKRKDIRVGDRVVIQRAGDVIPQIVRVLENKNPQRSDPFVFPTTCPVCGSPVIREEKEVATRCTGNFKCAAQIKERLNHFVSRHAFDIEGLGGKSIDFFWEKNLIKTPVDIFTLQERDAQSLTPLRHFPGWGQKSAENLFQSIEEKRHINFDRFLYALGIHHIGQVTAKAIARHYKTADHWNNAMTSLHDESSEEFQKLLSIDGIGYTIATSLMMFFKEPSNKNLITTLLSILDVRTMETLETQSMPLKGKTILFTGTLQSMTREDAKTQAEQLGAKVTNTISPKTHILVVGENPGSKLEKAKKLNIKVLSENEWINFIKQEAVSDN